MKELHDVFNLEEDLFRPTKERNIPFKLKIDKIIYLNKEQYHLMKEEYQREREEHYKNDRGLISFKIRKIYFIQLNKYKVVKINFLSLFFVIF